MLIGMSDKEMVIETLSRLPDSVSLSQIQEELRILAAIRKGQTEAEAGNVVPHGEVVKMVEGWASR
jgi:predicted transcriptional regulator